MSEKQDADKLIKALEAVLTIWPDGAEVRRYVGDKLDDAPMPPEEFVEFARVLLQTAKEIRSKYEQ